MINTLFIKLCLGGGLFAILGFIHFFVDFICQTHYEAMNKHNKPWIRARHCLTYAAGFVPLLLWFWCIGVYSGIELFIAVNVLFWSHFIEDTYYPVLLWCQYIRRPPEMTDPISVEIGKDVDGKVIYKVLPPDPKAGFIKFINTTLGKILMIAVDQIIHFAFLFPIVYMALN